MNTLHLNDLDAIRASRDASDRTRRTAGLITAAFVVLIAGAFLFVRGDEAPRPLATAPATEGASDTPAVAAEGVTAPTLPVGADAAAPDSAATLSVPAGTKLSLEVTEAVSTADAIVGKEIVATLAAPVMVDGAVAVPAGAKVVGRVTETLEVSATEGNGIFGVAFDRLEVDGQTMPIVAELKGQRLELAPGRRLELELSSAIEVPAAAEAAATTPAG